MTPEEIIIRVKGIRNRKGLTQGRLARRIDVDPKYIAYIEDGNVGEVPMNILNKIEDTIDYLED